MGASPFHFQVDGWQSSGGDMPMPQVGFPYLSAAERLVIKDIIMMAGGLLVASDSARRIMKLKNSR